MIHPRDFITEYVHPAIELSRTNRTVKHLAIHAISQLDVLAEIVALWTLLNGRKTLRRQVAPGRCDDMTRRIRRHGDEGHRRKLTDLRDELLDREVFYSLGKLRW